MELIPILPHLQAALNLTSAALLISGIRAIRRRDRETHQKRMVGALVVSAFFLVSYLVYHAAIGNVKFAGVGLIRPVYFTILIAHVVMAVVSLPLIFLAVRRAPWQIPGFTPFEPHRRIARYALPVWLFVSISGLVVYGLAFHLYPPQ
ncbi:MAG: DUF420 domain-containing protein [Magnetococcales bacterium]|nr:DUF420 domain-containing protein [Magnetococcales bacterium]MBF0439890.1 DUF420 domain-containing protein [Magnetococcales bacterium]